MKQQESGPVVHRLALAVADDSLPCSSGSKTAVKSAATEHPAVKKWAFREIVARSAHLTRAFRERGVFTVLPPVELMNKGKIDPNLDILDEKVFSELCAAAAEPHQLWHFGFPCGSFGIMQNMNKGTRTADNPLGGSSLHSEKNGNEILCNAWPLQCRAG